MQEGIFLKEEKNGYQCPLNKERPLKDLFFYFME
jgi:hypothetical protein